MPEEHIERLRGVFEKLSAAGLTLKLNNCEIFQAKNYLFGSYCFQRWYRDREEKVIAIQEWPIPKAVSEVCSFLGFMNYYHKFIPKYAQIA